MRILVIEDDNETAAYILRGLSEHGHAVERAPTGRDGLFLATDGSYDLIVLDRMLPGMDGMTLLKTLRAADVRTPVLMLTARGEEIDRVVGLEMGADDYLAKPFSARELVARVRAVLRRMADTGADGVLGFGALKLDSRAHRAQLDGQDLELTSAELRILELLMQADTRTVSREELMLQALGRRLLPTDRSLDTHVSNLRRKLARLTERISIQGVRGAGYALTQR